MNDLIIDELYEKPEDVHIAYVSFWPRVGASLLDGLILAPVALGVSFYNLIYVKSYILAVLISAFGLGYKVWMEKAYGATLGKQIVGIKITTESLGSLNYRKALLRNYFGILTFILAVFQQYATYSLHAIQAADSFGEAMAAMQYVDPLYTYINYVLFAVYIIDCFIMFSNDRKQTFHDTLAATVAIKTK